MTGAERVERLRAAAADAGLDAFLVTSDESIAYLIGFRPLQLERLFGVVVRAAGGGAVIVPRLDLGQVGSAPAELDRVSYGAASDGMPELVEALAGREGSASKRTTSSSPARAHSSTAGLEPTPAAGIVMALRARKDAEEIERVRQRVRARRGGALRKMFDELRPGAVEREVNARVESLLRRAGRDARRTR